MFGGTAVVATSASTVTELPEAFDGAVSATTRTSHRGARCERYGLGA
jgi:hypothetical protein